MAVDEQRLARRMIGAYYTPEPVAQALVEWANPDLAGRILDPSFGGCSFLGAAVTHAQSGGLDGSTVFGVDLDEAAFDFARSLMCRGLPRGNVVRSDFFDVSPESIGGHFAAVVGNPPYIRHHWLTSDQKARAQRAATAAGVSLPSTADAWAYFVVHATSFLEKGGRLAFVLPAAVIYARYAEAVVAQLRECFSHVSLIRITQRLFSDTDSRTVIVAAAGFGSGPANLTLADIRDVSALADALACSTEERGRHEPRDLPLLALSPSQRNVWSRYSRSEAAVPLGSVADIRIGVVTGANGFFVRPAQEALDLASPHCRPVPVVSRASDLRLAALRATDFDAGDGALLGQRLLVISGDVTALRPRLRELVASGEAGDLHRRSHTSKRDRWYELQEVDVPDAFMPYMGATPASLSLNQAHVTSTNGVHRVWWKSTQKCLADAVVGSWTSAFQVGAELSGRHYGGGVLKVEPGEARRIMVPIVDGAGKHLPEIDRLVREGNAVKAVELADSIVLDRGMGLSRHAVASIRSAATVLAVDRRVGPR